MLFHLLTVGWGCTSRNVAVGWQKAGKKKTPQGTLSFAELFQSLESNSGGLVTH